MNNTRKILKKHNISLSVYNDFISNCVIFSTTFITFNNFLNLPTTQYNVLVIIALDKFNKESTTDSSSTTDTIVSRVIEFIDLDNTKNRSEKLQR